MESLPWLYVSYVLLLNKCWTDDRAQPKIITVDGNLEIQSATNRNISFQSDGGNMDVVFGDTSINKIKAEIESLKDEIAAMKTSAGPCKKHKCKNGVCIAGGETGDGYICVCQMGFTGKYCDS